MAEFHFPHKLINLIKASIIKNECKVRIETKKLEQIPVRTKLRHGDSLSSLLINIALEKGIIDINIEQHKGVNLQGLQVYADDLVLLSELQN